MIALLRRTEQLMVFADDPKDDYMEPYQAAAPALLVLPEGEVDWYAEDPSGRHLLPVPARFVGALIDGQVDEAMLLLRAAALAYRRSSPEPERLMKSYRASKIPPGAEQSVWSQEGGKTLVADHVEVRADDVLVVYTDGTELPYLPDDTILAFPPVTIEPKS